MYDYPMLYSPSSTPPSPRKQHRRRSHSPLPHLATLLPSTHHHHHHQYSPSSRAADISRLLDPSYASSSSSSSMSTSPASSTQPQTRAYVDQHGNLHDPDYRDFPILRMSAHSPQPGKRRRTSAGNAARPHSRDRTSSLTTYATRPAWERDGLVEEVDSDDEDEDELDSQTHFTTTFIASHALPRKKASTSPLFQPYTPPFWSDTLMTSPVGSYDDEHTNALQLHESPFEDETEEVFEEPRSKSNCLLRKVSNKSRSGTDHISEKDDEDVTETRPSEADDNEDTYDTTPTCTHLLRQRWQAISLSVRFSVFHAKRRLTRHRTK